MATMTAAALLSTLESPLALRPGTLVYVGLAVVAAGSLLTAGRRLAGIVRDLEAR
jgi:hypothetical protein